MNIEEKCELANKMIWHFLYGIFQQNGHIDFLLFTKQKTLLMKLLTKKCFIYFK